MENKEIKICMFAPLGFFTQYGGGEIYIRTTVDEIINHQRDLFLDLFVISMSNHEEIQKYKGIKVFNVCNTNQIETILKEEKPDIVHAHGRFEQIIPTCRQLGIKSVVTMHDCMYICPNYTYLDYNGHLCEKKMSVDNCLRCYLKRIKGGFIAWHFLKLIPTDKYVRLGKWLDKRPFMFFITPFGQAAVRINEKKAYWVEKICSADCVIQLSNRMAKMAYMNGLAKEKLSILPNGVFKNELPVVLPHEKNTIDFFYIGRICYSKGVHVLLKAFHSINDSNCMLHIIGSTDNEFARTIKKRYHRDSRIIWHNQIPHSDIYNQIKNYNTLIHPSTGNESYSLAVAEALAAGKYVIATRCGGPEDQIVEGVNGKLVEPNNVEALRSAIQSYIDNPIAPKEIRYVSIEEHVSNLVKIYKSLG